MQNRLYRASLMLTGLLLAIMGCSANGPAVSSERTSPPVPPAQAGDSWTTYHHDPGRHGFDPLANPASGQLASAWTRSLDGAVYGEPLVVGGKVLAVTENDSVYALSTTGQVLWRRHLGTPVSLSTLPCGNIDPLGVTGTPVYDAASGKLLVAAELASPVRHRLFALDPATGSVSWSRDIDPAAMDPVVQQERGALAIADGRAWVPFGGLAGDCGDYHGWLVGVPLSGTGALSVYRTPSAREAGIWAPSGPAVDGAGHQYVAVGNGAATSPPYDDSDSVLKLQGNQVVSLFAPSNWAAENASDQDLGSTGPALVSALGKAWVYADGKAGNGYLLNRKNLGGIGGQAATLSGCKSFGGTAVRAATIYVPCVDGMRAVQVVAGPSLHVAWHNSDAGYGASPVLGGGAVWAISGGQLLQIDPTNGVTVASITIGECPHFATPTLHGSLVFVGTTTGVTAVRTS
ncbi:MAG: PQQ-binding-like beta-propeller repeat protein [Nocardioidaceae bacterium]